MPGITAVRLDCTDCLDAAAFGSIPAALAGEGTLREARIDLTDSRAWGLYDLVVQRPGQPDAVLPLTVRPYLSAVSAEVRFTAGMRVRPAGVPGLSHNYSRYDLVNLTNGTAAFPFVQVDRPVPDLVSLILASDHAATGNRFYESELARDPLARPILVAAVPADIGTSFEVGLRIDPSDVLFPEQTATGPDDPRLPFGQGQFLFFTASNNTTFERAAEAVREAVTGTGRGDLDGYLAQVAAADPDALGAAAGASLLPVSRVNGRALGVSAGLLAAVIERLDKTVAAPGGLAAAAAPAFETSLLAAIDGLGAREVAASAAALAGSDAVRTLYQVGLTQLSFLYQPSSSRAEGRRSQRGDPSA